MFNWFKKKDSTPIGLEFTEQEIDILTLFSNTNFDPYELSAAYKEQTLIDLTAKLKKTGFLIDKRTQVLF